MYSSRRIEMTMVYAILFSCVCALLVSCSGSEDWDVDYVDNINTEIEESDEYGYSPYFRGHFSDTDNFMITADESETTNNDIDQNTISALPESTGPVVNTETVVPSEESGAIKKLVEQVDKLMSEVKAQQDKITELENDNRKLKSKVDFVEEQTKTNSLIFFNVHENERENHRMTLSKVMYVINKVMKVRLSANDISVALRASLADTSNSTQYRPIIVRMAKFVDKMRVVAAAGKLSRTNMVVAIDYSERVAQVRRQLLPYLEEVRAEGRRAFLLYDSLVVDGERLTLEQLEASAAAAATAAAPATPASECEQGRHGDVEQVEVEPETSDEYYR